MYQRTASHNHISRTVDMTQGSIPRILLTFCVPLILGNLFQVFYNTVDAMVVGNFIGKEALAAVASTGPLINIAVFTFNGIAVGAGIVIGQYFGAHEMDDLHRAVETTMTMAFLCSILFTAGGILLTPALLRLVSTPDDVIGPATTYLQIYFAGITGLLTYNMGSGVLRAVGDTRRPLYFLIISSVTNIVLDLVFVIIFHMGIAGAAVATILAQFLSALMILALLTMTEDVYRLSWKDLGISVPILKKVLAVGLPAGFQSMITSFSNNFLQAYINTFGSTVMAGWGCYTKVNQVFMLPIQSMGHTAATFVSQNIGAGNEARANQGTRDGILGITVFNIVMGLFVLTAAPLIVGIFTTNQDVVDYGVLFIRMNIGFYLVNGVNHTLAGSMRGRGNARAPMLIMLLCFVGIRQIYLFIAYRLTRSAALIGFGYPVGWIACCIVQVIYYYRKYLRKC